MLSPFWVTGFADGEGCFVIGAYRRMTRKGYYLNMTPRFSISQKAVDVALLNRIREHFGVGRVVKKTAPSYSQPMKQFEVTRIADFATIVQHFDSYPLQTTKAADFVLWRRAVMLLIAASQHEKFDSGVPKGRRRYTDADIEQLFELHEQLQAGRHHGTCQNL